MHTSRRPPGLRRRPQNIMQTHSTSSSWAPALPGAGPPSGCPRPGSRWRCSRPASRRAMPTSPSTSRVRPAVSRQGERVDAPHAAAAARLLRLPRVELRLVRQRPRGAVHEARRQAVQLAGPHARGRRPDQCLGTPVLPPERTGPQRQVVRRLRRGLADSATRTSSRTTTSSRITSASRDRPRTSPSCPTAASIPRCR